MTRIRPAASGGASILTLIQDLMSECLPSSRDPESDQSDRHPQIIIKFATGGGVHWHSLDARASESESLPRAFLDSILGCYPGCTAAL
jgi:hypothetical protein